MKLTLIGIGLAAALAMVGLSAALAAEPDVVIGDIDDMAGVVSDNLGMGGVEAINMAIADFGGTVLGRKIVLLYADHQNKPDIAVSKAREWADQNGLNMLFGGTNTGAAIAIAKIMPAKKVPLFITGAGGASLTNEDCTAYTVHGLMIHDLYVIQVKTPQESKYPWDYYKVVKVMKGEEAFGPITGLCPLAPK